MRTCKESVASFTAPVSLLQEVTSGDLHPIYPLVDTRCISTCLRPFQWIRLGRCIILVIRPDLTQPITARTRRLSADCSEKRQDPFQSVADCLSGSSAGPAYVFISSRTSSHSDSMSSNTKLHRKEVMQYSSGLLSRVPQELTWLVRVTALFLGNAPWTQNVPAKRTGLGLANHS